MVNNKNGGSNIDNEKEKENKEKKEKKIQDKSADIYEKLYEDFSKSKEDDTSFLDDLYTDSYGVLTKLKKFKNSEEKYKDLDEDKISITNLQMKHKSDYLKLKNSRRILKSRIFKDYDITDTFYSSKIESGINKMNTIEIEKLFKSNNLDIFLGKLLGKNKPSSRDFLDTIKEIFGNINTGNLSVKDKNDIDEIYISLKSKHGVNSINHLEDDDILEILSLFKYNSINIEIKEKFLRNYFPYISLGDYKNIFKIDSEKLIEIKKEIISNNFPEFEKLDEIDQDLFVKGVKEEDLLFKTSGLSRTLLISLFSEGENLIKIGKLYKETYNEKIKNLKNAVEEDDLKKAGIETDGSGLNIDNFKESLLSSRKFSDVSKFKEGNIIYLDTVRIIEDKDSSGNKINDEFTNKVFLKIKKIDEKNKKITYYDYGSKGLYNPKSKDEKTMDFHSFLYFINNGIKNTGDQVHAGFFYTPDEIQEKVNKGDFKVDKDTLIQKSTDELTEEFAKKKLIEDGFNESEITYEQVSDYISKQTEYINKNNYDSLLSSINDIDSEGKPFGLDSGTTFVTKKGDYYTIEKVDKQDGIIYLHGAGSNDIETVPFTQFYETYKDLDGKRRSNVRDIESLITNATDNIDSWKGFKNKDGKIVKKSTNDDTGDKQTNIEYDYLVSGNDKNFVGDFNLIKIENISGDTATITLGSKEETKDSKKDEKTVFSMNKSSIQVKLSVLESWIKKSKMGPESLESHKDVIEAKYDTVDRKTNIFSKFFSGISFNEMIKGGEFWVESVKSYLGEGNEEHAARFAEGVLGKVLPKGMRYDIKSRLEAAQKKRMEDYKQRLKDLDSGDATDLVYKWLINKNSPEPQKEAAMIFMMESYGSLYAKNALFKHRGKFLWYEAMGGKVGDALFTETIENAAKINVQFTEEDLIYRLIAGQCKGKSKPKRRGRLYKEIEALVGKGREEEFEKGKKDASKKRTIGGRVKFAIEELEGGSYPNAMGAFEEIVGKGDDGNMTTLNKLPFVMAFSGLAYDFDQKMVDGFKNNPASGRPVMSTMFLSNPSSIDLFSETVLELSKDLSKIHSDKFPDMYKDAQAIYGKQKDSTNQKEKVGATIKFFDSYGEVLTRSMNMLMTGKADELTKTDQIILLKKDEKGKGIYKRYFNTLKSMLDNNSDFSKEEYMTDAFICDDGEGGGSGIIGMSTYNIAKDTLMQAQGGGFRLSKSGPQIWNGFIYAIDEVKKTDYSGLGLGDSKEIQKTIIKDKLRGLLGGLLLHHGANPNALRGLMDGTSSFYTKFNEWGVTSDDFIKTHITSDRILDTNDESSNNLLEKYANNILNGKSFEDRLFTIPEVKEEVESNVNGIVNS